jgi:hypothetical protein
MLIGVGTCIQQMAAADEIQVAAYLDAGEFGPAIAIATQSSALPEFRDSMLMQIARSQFDAGARKAAFHTASLVKGQQERTTLLGEFSSKRFSTSQLPQVPAANASQSPQTSGAMGGGIIADFDPLMELIRTTIAPETWDEAGGTGTIGEFAAGVTVDPSGSLRRIEATKSNPRLEELRAHARSKTVNTDARRASSLRKVSLTRLEKQLQLRLASGMPVDEEMYYMAGIYELRYLLVYPESGDIVIASPAGAWEIDAEGRRVNIETGKPLLRLDDFVVCLRNAFSGDGEFGCTINPRKENLLATQQYLATTKETGEAWRNGIRDALGKQDIIVNGIDPQTPTARTLVEADYRMKLVGMGIEEGVPEVESYLDLVQLDAKGNPPPMDVARWWFTLNYKGIAATEDRDGFEFRGNGVQVLSEQELINKKGERVHTGETAGPTLEFADSFTTHFSKLAAKYPIYAELKNVFDFALVTAIIRSENLDGKAHWDKSFFGAASDPNQFAYEVPLSTAAKEVDSVMNHRIIEQRVGKVTRRHTILGVSGGVTVSTRGMIERPLLADEQSSIQQSRTAIPANLEQDAWWWD